MSSPRGFVVGGIGAMGTDATCLESGLLPRRVRSGLGVGCEGRDCWASPGVSRGKRKASGLNRKRDRRGRWRTFRYMLKLRSARFA